MLKKTLVNTIQKSSRFLSFSMAKKWAKPKAILPFYHSISDREMPHIKHLYAVKNSQAFEQDIDFLLQHFEAVDFSTFYKIQQGEIISKKPCFLLSFDDGLQEFHEIIAPILLRKGVPAICFLNSAFIDNKDLFFRYKVSLLIDFLKKNPKQIKAIGVQSFAAAQRQLLAINYQNKRQLDIWAKAINFSFEQFLEERKPYLSTAQIQALIKQGFDFGAHSIDHPEYQYISLQEQLKQTQESMAFVQQKFDLKHRLFSFPFTDFGVSKAFFETIHQQKTCTATFGCAGQKADTANHHFQRIPFEKDHFSAEEILKTELFYSSIKQLLGKNTIDRK